MLGSLLQAAAIIDDNDSSWLDHPTNSHAVSHNKKALSSVSSSSDETIQHMLSSIGQWQRDHNAKQQHPNETDHDFRLPFVLLTFAQTLDGMIASRTIPSDQDEADTPSSSGSSGSGSSSNLALSGAASFRLTHALRSIHDAILIGGATLATDHPRLTNRLWPTNHTGTTTCHSSQQPQQPRPVILDTHLRHYWKSAGAWRVRNAIVCCSHEAASQHSQQRHDNDNDDADKNDLHSKVTLLPCRVSSMTGRLCLEHVLEQLKSQFGIRSVMVEGGATVLSEFASYTQESNDNSNSNNHLVSAICITIAPKLLGAKCGVPAFPNRQLPLITFLQDDSMTAARSTPTFTTLGSDCIFLSKWPQS